MQSKVNVLLDVRKIDKSFNDIVCLERLSLNIIKGEILFICGHSGVGKTSLIEILCKYTTPQSGEILLNEIIVTNKSTYECNFKYLPKDPIVFPYMTIKENLWLGFRDDCCATYSRKEEVVTKTLLLLGIERIQNKKVHELSYSEKYLISFARAIVQNSPIVFIDEPFNSLDNIAKKTLKYAIIQYNKIGVTFVIASNNLLEAKDFPHRIMVLEHHQIRDCGTYESLTVVPKSKYTAQIFAQMYSIKSNLIELEENVIIIGNMRKSMIVVPKSIIKYFSIYHLAEKTITFFIHYKNIYYRILNSTQVPEEYKLDQKNKAKDKRYQIDTMYFICNSIKRGSDGNIVELSLCGNNDFTLRLVIPEDIDKGAVLCIGFNCIDLFLIEKNI